MHNMFHSVDLLIGKLANRSSVIATRVVEDTKTPAAFLPDANDWAVNQWRAGSLSLVARPANNRTGIT